MSNILNTSAQGLYKGPITKNDESLQDPVNPGYSGEAYYGYNTYQDFLWSRSRFTGAPAGYSVFDDMPVKYSMWPLAHRPGGTSERVAVSGQVVNSSGTGISGVIVKLYDTPTDTQVDSQTSDGSGYYIVGSPYSSNAYAVGYKSGAPDQAGTTVNTVTA